MILGSEVVESFPFFLDFPWDVANHTFIPYS